MNYISKNTIMRYWRIRIVPINDRHYGTAHTPVFKGKTVEGALKAAERYCKNSKCIDDDGTQFQVYGVAKENPIEYECNAWGYKIAPINK